MSSPGRPAAFFDLDKTIIAKSSVMAFGRPFYQGGLINRRALLKSTYAQFVYLVGGADHDQIERMRAYLSQLCKGWDVEQVKAI
ncbi:MAG TPA: haloacid dehalogenase-like hydrolase, partial [Acidothermaceae bacterium]|nr:haloacid dehalogenase-like hydrolase [Acidothermaceae bacterium]